MAKNEGKLSFVLYCSQFKYVSKLTDEQAGILFKHIYRYCNDENPSDPTDQAILIAWECIKDQLKKDLEAYRLKCEKNKENAGKRWNANEQKPNTNECDRIRTHTNVSSRIKSYSDNDNDIDNDFDNDNALSNDNIKEYKLSNDNILSQTLRYWNEKSKQYRTANFKMPTHKTVTPAMEKAINKALSLYGWNNITLAIERYAQIGNDDSYYFNYVWTLEEFLKQSNALPEFLDDGSKWKNYCSSKSGIRKQEQNVIRQVLGEEWL